MTTHNVTTLKPTVRQILASKATIVVGVVLGLAAAGAITYVATRPEPEIDAA